MFAATYYSYKTLFEQHLNQSKSQRNVQWAFSNYRDLKSAAEIILKCIYPQSHFSATENAYNI